MDLLEYLTKASVGLDISIDCIILFELVYGSIFNLLMFCQLHQGRNQIPFNLVFFLEFQSICLPYFLLFTHVLLLTSRRTHGDWHYLSCWIVNIFFFLSIYRFKAFKERVHDSILLVLFSLRNLLQI